MRNNMDAAEYKHVVLGLIFLKYISDAFEEKREQLLFGFSDPKSEWFSKDEPQRAEAAENRVFSLSASNGERAGVSIESLATSTASGRICIPPSRPSLCQSGRTSPTRRLT